MVPSVHQRPARHRERLQRVRRDLQRDRDVLPRRGEKPAAEARLRCEADRVEHAVEPAADTSGERVEMGGVGDVELDDRRLGREPARRPLREAHRPAERGEHHLRAFLLAPAGQRWNAIDASFRTPVTRMRLSASSMRPSGWWGS